jgi:hypothetical protein
MRSLEQVPQGYRWLLMLLAVGFSYAEIARITGDSIRTVERQVLRGRRALNVARGVVRPPRSSGCDRVDKRNEPAKHLPSVRRVVRHRAAGDGPADRI